MIGGIDSSPTLDPSTILSSHKHEFLKREKFISVFLEKNKELNLSAIRDEQGVFIKHVCDALEIQSVEKEILDRSEAGHLPSEERSFSLAGKDIVDVGMGGGIPLLPLALTYPTAHFTGIDSIRKKTIAVADMVHKLDIHNVEVVWSRIENYTEKGFDILTARAVAYSDALFANAYHLVKKGGCFVLYKMFSEEEEGWLDNYVKQRSMTMIRKHYYKLFEEDIQRVIYVVKKG